MFNCLYLFNEVKWIFFLKSVLPVLALWSLSDPGGPPLSGQGPGPTEAFRSTAG